MAAISRYMELTIEPVQQVSGRGPQPGVQRVTSSHRRLPGGGGPLAAEWTGGGREA